MKPDDKETLDQVLNCLDRLMRMFQIERILYLVAAIASLLLFIYSGYRLFSQETIKAADITILLGATGVSSTCATRVAFFLNKAFKLIELVVSKLVVGT